MTPDVSKYKLSTLQDTFKNFEILEETITVPAYTFPSGDNQILTYSYEFSQPSTISQIIARLSYDPDKWHILPLLRANTYSPSAKTSLQMFSSYTANSLVLTFDITPVGVAPYSYPEFTVDFRAKMFVMPSQ